MRRRYALIAGLATIGIALTIGQAHSQSLSDPELQNLVSGHRLGGTNGSGQQYYVCMQRNYTMSASSNNSSGPQHDTGIWAVRGGKVCLTWRYWQNGMETCAGIEQEGGRYKWQGGRSNGMTLTVDNGQCSSI